MKLSLLVSKIINVKMMGSFFLPIIVSSILLTSCDSTPTQTNPPINLFDGFKYVLKPGEKEVPKSAVSVQFSNELKFVLQKPQLILYKHIKHKDYDTYVYIDLDSTITKENLHKTITLDQKKVIFYQHMIDTSSEITSITLLKNDTFKDRFSEDSLSSERFTVEKLNHESNN